jgi:hypothetical protein
MGVLLPPGTSAQGFWELYGTKLLYAFVAYMIIRFVVSMWPMPGGRRRVVVRKKPVVEKEGFQPREETDDSWVRL